MPVSGELYLFSDENISKSPTGNGVYALYDKSQAIYIGKAEQLNGIRARLQAHKRGDEGSCTQDATAYRREPCTHPAVREAELLVEHRTLYGALPRCNERVG